jgi:hypothetical protein
MRSFIVYVIISKLIKIHGIYLVVIQCERYRNFQFTEILETADISIIFCLQTFDPYEERSSAPIVNELSVCLSCTLKRLYTYTAECTNVSIFLSNCTDDAIKRSK